MTLNRTVGPALVLLLVTAPGNADEGRWAAIKDGAKEAGSEVAKGAGKGWQQLKEAGRQIGRTVKETAGEVRKEVKTRLDD